MDWHGKFQPLPLHSELNFTKTAKHFRMKMTFDIFKVWCRYAPPPRVAFVRQQIERTLNTWTSLCPNTALKMLKGGNKTNPSHPSKITKHGGHEYGNHPKKMKKNRENRGRRFMSKWLQIKFVEAEGFGVSQHPWHCNAGTNARNIKVRHEMRPKMSCHKALLSESMAIRRLLGWSQNAWGQP